MVVALSGCRDPERLSPPSVGKPAVDTALGERVYASSPEDNLLWKLRWFRMGGEVSDQQWRDVLGLLRVSGPKMDPAYLRRWAGALGVGDLLDRALAQAPI
jgi:hypothetical protein